MSHAYLGPRITPWPLPWAPTQVRSASDTRIFIDLHLPRPTHLHDAQRLSCVRCVSVWTRPRGAILKSSRSPERCSCHWCGPSAIFLQLWSANLLFTVPSCKVNAELTVARCKANAGPCSQDQKHPLLKVFAYAFAFTLPKLIMQQAFPMFDLG